ncbi:hypothetical protein DPMN_088055 [Dreissena polymorpha]|uniref:Uncharacterized protein n=1 Tax=Dreissena polymorpha TaxID=45954 RepID=A0A9D4KTF8_DREPO|nr:hypothetical protein DPMN_088055 [Dreissena polymorpha]
MANSSSAYRLSALMMGQSCAFLMYVWAMTSYGVAISLFELLEGCLVTSFRFQIRISCYNFVCFSCSKLKQIIEPLVVGICVVADS